jgi:nitrite reductase/ring-hydroxylating ferredoxin subunit/Fe-S cluster biogenesis protein NfuA
MPGEDRPLQNDDRMTVLLQTGGTDPVAARGSVEDLVRQVADLYGSGLRRIMEILHDRGKLDDATVEALTADSLVSGLLVLHGLHARPLEARVAAALDRLRPYLGSHGRDVELEGASPDGVVRLKLVRTDPGGPHVSAPLKSEVEAAIKAAAPEVTAIDVAEVEKQAGSPELIPLDSLPVRTNNPADATPAAPWHDMLGGSWEPVPEIAGLEPREVAAYLIGGYPVLACRSGQDVYAYRDYCPRCTGSMAGATLNGDAAAEVRGSLLSCPTCRGHFEVRHAGACLEDKDLHLDPLPLLVRGGVLCVAIPRESADAAPLPAVTAPPGPTEATPVQAIPLVAPSGQAASPVLATEPASLAVSSLAVTAPAVAVPPMPVSAAAELPAAAGQDA